MTKVALVTLGCSKNQVDSDVMEELLDESGFTLCNDIFKADVLLINTCGFIEAAREESVNAILEAAELKKAGRCQKLIVTGCLAQRYGKELAQEIPEIDALIGTGGLEQISGIVKDSLEKKRNIYFKQPGFLEKGVKRNYRQRKIHHSEYVKIAEGCDHRCSFCIIPELRGPYASRPKEEIIEEVRRLLYRGAKEITLIAQDSTLYGRDLYQKSQLADLLEILACGDFNYWLRILYAYPQHLNEDILRVIAAEKNICNYLDMPLQHSEEKILRAMGRPGKSSQLLKLLDKIRDIVPGITLRSTFIVGFPGETDEDFRRLLQFLQAAKFDWAGFFPYSQEEHTAAAEMKGQIPEKVKLERYQEAVNLQEQISRSINNSFIGRELEVLVDGKSEERPGLFQGRAERNAPDVDGIVWIKSNRALQPGNFVKVRIIENEEYDLLGENIDEFAQ